MTRRLLTHSLSFTLGFVAHASLRRRSQRVKPPAPPVGAKILPLTTNVTRIDCPVCRTPRIWNTWVAVDSSDTDSWACVNGHTWAERV